MSYEVNDRELQSVLALPAQARYRYFLNKITDWEELWSVGDETGWALMSDGATELAPVWPAAAFARESCTGDWQNNKPKPIALGDWIAKWIPGLENDGRKVAVFPLRNDHGIVVSPERLKEDILGALEAYE